MTSGATVSSKSVVIVESLENSKSLGVALWRSWMWRRKKKRLANMNSGDWSGGGLSMINVMFEIMFEVMTVVFSYAQ
ncbi:MAG: hypothetical protein C5B47_02805 [Verrucomicrobia bacterium]|nr:MAG: hypothetical protein C5B47_02805 [Verrucomicrobiota bacterium]